MAKHFRVVIDVSYDEAHPIPDELGTQLYDNVTRCVERGELLNDDALEAVVDDWKVRVEDL